MKINATAIGKMGEMACHYINRSAYSGRYMISMVKLDREGSNTMYQGAYDQTLQPESEQPGLSGKWKMGTVSVGGGKKRLRVAPFCPHLV